MRPHSAYRHCRGRPHRIRETTKEASVVSIASSALPDWDEAVLVVLAVVQSLNGKRVLEDFGRQSERTESTPQLINGRLKGHGTGSGIAANFRLRTWGQEFESLRARQIYF
jgi:hypothetical protein